MKHWDKYLKYRGLTPQQVDRNLRFLKSAHKFSRELRERATPSEKALREFLRESNVCYKFQHVIFINHSNIIDRFFIADFYIPKLNLIIELDGKHHYNDSNLLADSIRDSQIRGKGFNILRMPNKHAYNYNLLFNLITRGQWVNHI